MGSKREEARKLLDAEVKPGVEIRSNRDAATFERLTNTPHQTLVANWKSGGIMSACNGFAGWYATKLGIRGIESFFKLEASLRKINKGYAWVPADGKVDPQLGDILHHSKGGTGLHVDVCIGFTSDRRLIRAAAGQIAFHKPRNPAAEFDVLKRVTGDKAYNVNNLLGWLDIERFFQAATNPITNWVVGWWDVNDGQQYYYHFATSGQVQYTRSRPTSMLAPPKTPLSSGAYSFLPNRAVFIRWNPLDGGATEETFTPDSGQNTMQGRSSRYGPLVARRL